MLISLTSQIAVSAPSSGVRGADDPPIYVLTHPGQMELTTIPKDCEACARIIVAPFNPALIGSNLGHHKTRLLMLHIRLKC
jgi:hypothetical protein